MIFSNSKKISISVLFSLPVLFTMTEVEAASFDYLHYKATLANPAYSLNFMSAIEGNHDFMTYEEKNGTWQPAYYNYEYHLHACADNSCSSNNRFLPSSTIQNPGSPFYGIEGSAIYNTKYQVGEVNADFVNNSSYKGAAIFNGIMQNNNAKIGNVTGDFINNKATSNGGAIFNYVEVDSNGHGSAIIGDIKGNFIGNSSGDLGGAIYNNTNYFDRIVQIGKIEGNFIGNKAGSWGGAIYNHGIIGDVNADFISNSGFYGGAIMSNIAIGNINGNFIANTAAGAGGALHFSGYSTVGKINGLFIGNTAADQGGAIFNNSAKDFYVTGEFINNHADYGGAVYNGSLASLSNPRTAVVMNTNFFNNSADTAGGAIYHYGVINIIADNASSIFQGNTAGGVSNAIYVEDEDSEVNLTARHSGNLSFYDNIDGGEGYKLNLSGDNSGAITFHANISNGDISVGSSPVTRAAETVNVSFDDINNISNRNNSLIMNNGTLTFSGFGLADHHFRELKLNGGEININNADVDLEKTAMGRFVADNYNGGNTSVKVHHVNVLTDGGEYTAVDFADVSFAGQVENKVTKAAGPVYNYTVDYLADSGQFTFQRESINPEVKVPSYAAAAATSVLSNEIYSRILADADSNFNVGSGEYGIKPFIKTFGSDDKIEIKNFHNSDSKFYGVIGGLSTRPIRLSADWQAIYNIYLAYAKGEHEFSSQHVNQESGYLGASAIFSKGQFYIGSTINAAIMENRAHQETDKDKFTSYLGGLALKTGYNFKFGSDYTFQPNLYGSYTYISSNDYVTGRNARVKFKGMSNYELAPGIKLSKAFEDELEIYVKGRYVFNFNEGQDSRANGILLPDMELKNYAEVGVGFSKNWLGKDLKLFMEVSRREGGRDGWNGLAGINWAL